MSNVIESKSLILSSRGRIMGLEFIMRTNGGYRVMACRTGVHKGTTGKGKAYKDEHYDLLTVYDIQKRGFRSIPLDSIMKIKIKGKKYVLREDDPIATSRKLFKFSRQERQSMEKEIEKLLNECNLIIKL